jgi:hypothetical protein
MMGDFTIMCNFICSVCFVRRFLFLFYVSHIGFEPITIQKKMNKPTNSIDFGFEL